MIIVLPLEEGGIGLMHMAVNHDSGMIPIQQRTEALETPVSQILLIAQATDGGMGQEDIKTAGGPELTAEGEDPAGHILLRIHIHHPGTIADGTAEPKDPDATDQDDLPVGTETAFGRLLLIMVIMIPMDIDDRRAGKTGQKRRKIRVPFFI